MSHQDHPLNAFRHQIDALDTAIVDLLAQRYHLQTQIADVKFDHDIPVIVEERARHVIEQNVVKGMHAGLPEDFIRDVYEAILDAAHKRQSHHMASKK